MRLFGDFRELIYDGDAGIPGWTYGVRLRMVPALAELQFEVQRANNSGGAPGTWSTIGFYGPYSLAGGAEVDERPANTQWWYRARHVGAGYDPGPWSTQLLATSRLLSSHELFIGLRPPVYPIIRDEPLVDGFYALQSDLTDGSNVRKESTIGSINAHMISRAQHGVFIETFEELPATWNLRASLGTQVESIVSTGETGGKAYKAEGYVWRAFPRNIPFDPSKLYRIRVRARRTATTDTAKDVFYCGVEGVAGDGVTLVNTAGSDSSGSQHYVAASGVDSGSWTVDVWQVYTGWFKGHGTYVANASDARSPSGLHANVRYFRPLFILNYDSGPTGNKMELDYIAVDVFDEESQARTYEVLDASGTNGIRPTAGVLEGSAVHKIYRHKEEITINGADTDGDVAVSFTQTYQNVPLVIFRGGQYVSFSNTLGTSTKQRLRMQVLNLTTSGFTSRSQICNPGATTAQSDDFAAGALTGDQSTTGVGNNKEADLQPGGAASDTYTVNWTVTMTAVGSGSPGAHFANLTIAIETNDGGGWVERYTRGYSVGSTSAGTHSQTWSAESQSITVSGLGTGDDIRLLIKAFSVTGQGPPTGNYSVDPSTVTYNTASDTTESAIPSDGDQVIWVAQEVA